MAQPPVAKKGRGFNEFTGRPARGSRGHPYKSQRNYYNGPPPPSHIDSNPRRLTPPPFPDEEVDREEIVHSGRPRRTSHGDAHSRTDPITSPPESSGGGVKLQMPSAVPAVLSEEPEKPKAPLRHRAGYGGEIYMPRAKRLSMGLGLEAQPSTVAEERPVAKGPQSSGLDTSNSTRPIQMQTLEQALKSQSIGNNNQFRQQSAPTSPSRPRALRSQTQAKPPRATPTPTEVLTGALKTLSPRAPRYKDQSTPIQAAKATQKENPQLNQSTIGQVSNVSVVIGRDSYQEDPPTAQASNISVVIEGDSHKGDSSIAQSSNVSVVIGEDFAALTIEETPPNTIESITDLDIEETSANTNDEHVEVEDFEPYQLGLDERFASESSDESESVTSTIRDYDEVSDEEAASKSGSGSGSGSGSEAVTRRRKAKPKPKPIETSDGKIYYEIAVGEEPYVPLAYEVSITELTRLVAMKENSKERVWSYTLYSREGQNVTVETCSTLEEIETGAQRFLNEKAIGFDMEWLSRSSKNVWDNVSLIQLAKEDHITLFHIARLKKKNVDEMISPSLRKIIESKDILKLGVQVAGDGSRIKKWLGIEPQGLMELSAIHHVLDYARERKRGSIPKVLVSLSKLCEQYLQLPISKGYVRISDWTKPLSPSQISYAATDAYAGLRIFDELQKARMLIDPIPMLPACVKPNEDKKKELVTPKLYIDGVEAGGSGISTWDTQTTFETTPQDNVLEKSSETINWADDFEESKAELATISAAKPGRSRGKKATANDTNVSGEKKVRRVRARKEKKATANDTSANAEKEAPSKNAAKEAPSTNTNENRDPPANKKRSNKKAPSKADVLPLTPELQFATEWGNSHLAGSGVQLAQLKAYALWHIKEFSVEDTAAHMCIVPQTAASYIMNAIYRGKLQYDAERFKNLKNQYPPYYGSSGRRHHR